MALTEDLAELIDTDELAVAGTYGGNAVNFILDTQYEEVALGRMGASSRSLRALVVSSAITAAVGGVVVIGGVTYHVIEVQVDPPEAGPGFTLLMLEKQS